jgi:hypothetical protein
MQRATKSSSAATLFISLTTAQASPASLACGGAVIQTKGFVPTAQENGMLILYATAEGELDSDVGTGAGPCAKVLTEEIVKSRSAARSAPPPTRATATGKSREQ